MYRRASKKQEIIKRVAVYSVMTSLVLLIVAGLVLITLGYRFDSDNGRVEQGALLQFATVPSGATIKIDGSEISPRTPAKSSVLAGMHTFVMQRDGYETWQKTLDVSAGTLTWLNYARLVPKVRTTTAVAQYPTLHASLATTDGRSMLLQQDASTATFQLANLRSDDVKTTTLTLPATSYSQPTTAGVAHTFTATQWDSDGRYILVRHTYNDKNEWLVVDSRDVAATKNITTLLDVEISSVKFSGTSGAILYALSGSDIRKLDLSAATISGPLVTNVTSFDLYKTNVLTYIGTETGDATKRVVGLYREGDSAPHVLRTVTSAADVPLHIATTRYFDKDYVAIAEGNKINLYSGDYPSSDSEDSSSLEKFSAFNFVSGVERLSFSPSGDYLVVQSGANFASYDLEHRTSATSSIASNVTSAVGPLKWIDESYLWSDYSGTVSIREFDGTNSNTINKSVVGQAVVLSQNGRYLYSIGQTEKGYQLQRVRMILQ